MNNTNEKEITEETQVIEDGNEVKEVQAEINENKVEKAFITLLSSRNYIESILILNESFKKVKSVYSLVCAVVNDIYTKELYNLLTKNNIIVERVDRLAYSYQTRIKNINKPVLNTASKIEIFRLTKYKKLCYIDSDILVVKNIDDLLERKSGSMVFYPDENEGFSGMFVFSPDENLYRYYSCLIANTDCFDGDLLGFSWFFVKDSLDYQISPDYCCPYHTFRHTLDYKTIHFCNNENKPWFYKYDDDIVTRKFYEIQGKVREDNKEVDFDLYYK